MTDAIGTMIRGRSFQVERGRRERPAHEKTALLGLVT